MTERMIGLKIHLEGEERKKVEAIRQRVAARRPGEGSLYHEGRWSCLKGGDRLF